MEEGREIIMVGNKERNNDGKNATFKENDTVEIPTIFPPKLPNLGSFFIPCNVGMVEIERGLCDLGLSPASQYRIHLGIKGLHYH